MRSRPNLPLFLANVAKARSLHIKLIRCYFEVKTSLFQPITSHMQIQIIIDLCFSFSRLWCRLGRLSPLAGPDNLLHPHRRAHHVSLHQHHRKPHREGPQVPLWPQRLILSLKDLFHNLDFPTIPFSCICVIVRQFSHHRKKIYLFQVKFY